jgi:hypothetical protein
MFLRSPSYASPASKTKKTEGDKIKVYFLMQDLKIKIAFFLLWLGISYTIALFTFPLYLLVELTLRLI